MDSWIICYERRNDWFTIVVTVDELGLIPVYIHLAIYTASMTYIFMSKNVQLHKPPMRLLLAGW